MLDADRREQHGLHEAARVDTSDLGTGDDVAHHALVRWMTAGSEALLAAPPEMLVALQGAVDAGDMDRVKGITDALLAGWNE
jgi:hypothetical protein